jgi:hypothetical protein
MTENRRMIRTGGNAWATVLSWAALLVVPISAVATAEPVAPASPTTTDPTPMVAPPLVPAPATGVIDNAARRALPIEALGRLTLEVLLVNDADFPEVTAEAAEAILSQARTTLADKLSFGTLEFRVTGSESVASFMDRNVGVDDACVKEFEPLRVLPGSRPAKNVDPKLVRRFLSQWSVESLAAYFPEAERAGLTSYEALTDKLLAEFDRKVASVAGFKLANGASLLDPKRLRERSYVNWICALRNQDDADLILTNELVLYDLASEPYPHSIFAKCKVGGASLASPRRRAIYRRAVFASTFSMVTDLPFFQEEGAAALKPEERLTVIGTFIVAHELGHAVFKLPDFYDHPPECLMTTKFETGYVSGYLDLLAHPGPCPLCQPWVDAKRHVFLAEEAHKGGKYEAAIDHLRAAIKGTPKHVDGNYRRYIADLSVMVADNFISLGKTKEALQWVQAAVRIVPDHEEALRIQTRFAPRAPPPPPTVAPAPDPTPSPSPTP